METQNTIFPHFFLRKTGERNDDDSIAKCKLSQLASSLGKIEVPSPRHSPYERRTPTSSIWQKEKNTQKQANKQANPTCSHFWTWSRTIIQPFSVEDSPLGKWHMAHNILHLERLFWYRSWLRQLLFLYQSCASALCHISGSSCTATQLSLFIILSILN